VTPSEIEALAPLVGRAWLIGDRLAVPEIVRWVEAAAAQGFDGDESSFRPGDFLVGGLDVGIGAGNVRAATATLRRHGVGALIACSFGPPFYQSAIERGLPALVIEEAQAIQRGDRLRVDIEEHKIANRSSGDRYIIRNLYDEQLDVLRAGGLGPYRLLQARNGGTHQ
jgi:3-isopropylmalate dehydratase small subunit